MLNGARYVLSDSYQFDWKIEKLSTLILTKKK